MPSRFVLQPDGKLAVFSTVVDNFTHVNLTREEAVEVATHALDLGPRAAVVKVRAGLEDHVLDYRHPPTRGDGTSRWKHDCQVIRDVHGEEVLRSFLVEAGLAPEEPT